MDGKASENDRFGSVPTHRHVALRHRDGRDPELMEICQEIRLLVAAVLLQEFGGKHLWHMGSHDLMAVE